MPGGSSGRASTKSTSTPLRRAPSVTVTWVSTMCGEQVTYATTPPGRTARNAATSSSRCSRVSGGRSAGWRRQRDSGRRRSEPSPVHGASTSTRSNASSGRSGSRPTDRPSIGSTVDRHALGGLLDQPGPVLGDLDRGHLGAARPRRSRRAGRPCRPGRRTGPASGCPGRRSARPAARPRPAGSPRPARARGRRAIAASSPGEPPLQVDRVRGERARRCRPPRRPARPRRPGPGRAHRCTGGRLVVLDQQPRGRRPGRRRAPRRTTGRSTADGCAAPTGCRPGRRRTAGASSRQPGVQVAVSEISRITALAKPAAPGATERTRSTVWLTAACGGTRV